MSDGDLIEFGGDRHEIKCPHCHEQAAHNWPGKMILFARMNCTNCGLEFLIAMNKPQVHVKVKR